MNVDDLTAIDMHVHAEVSADGHPSLPEHFMSGSGRHFGLDGDRTPTIDQIAAHYRQRRMAAVVFAVDSRSATGHPPVPSEEIARACAEHADILIAFGSVDPWRGAEAVRRARTLATRYGVRGFKFHPSLQAFDPNDRMPTRCTRPCRNSAWSRCSTVVRPASAPDCAGEEGSG